MFLLLELVETEEIRVKLMQDIYRPAFQYLDKAILILSVNNLLKPFVNNLTLAGIITAGSFSIDLFNVPDSVIEGSVVNPIAYRNTVILVGPDLAGVVRDALDKSIKC